MPRKQQSRKSVKKQNKSRNKKTAKRVVKKRNVSKKKGGSKKQWTPNSVNLKSRIMHGGGWQKKNNNSLYIF